MNFLAHQYLSGEDELIRFGNFIADFVKGKKFADYPKQIRIGILFHREIDWYTDTHSIVKELNSELRSEFGKYAGVATDVYFDHFLAKNWARYSNQSLAEFSQETYALIFSQKHICPEKALHMLKYMKRDNWLFNYQFVQGVGRSLNGLSSRTNFKSGLEKGEEVMKKYYTEIEKYFFEFFAEIDSDKDDLLQLAISKGE